MGSASCCARLPYFFSGTLMSLSNTENPSPKAVTVQAAASQISDQRKKGKKERDREHYRACRNGTTGYHDRRVVENVQVHFWSGCSFVPPLCHSQRNIFLPECPAAVLFLSWTDSTLARFCCLLPDYISFFFFLPKAIINNATHERFFHRSLKKKSRRVSLLLITDSAGFFLPFLAPHFFRLTVVPLASS